MYDIDLFQIEWLEIDVLQIYRFIRQKEPFEIDV